MSIVLSARRIRLLVDLASSELALDIGHSPNRPPRCPRGNDLIVELGCFFGAAPLDLSGVESLTVEIRTNATRTGDPLASVTLVPADFNATLDADDWGTDDAYHARVQFTNAQTNQAATNDGTAYWLVVSVIMSGEPAKHVTLGGTTLTIWEDGAGTGVAPEPPEGATYLTDAQSDARYVPRAAGSTNVRWSAAKGFQILSPETGLWHTLVAVLVGGVATPMLDPTGEE